jgi:hypothetical protein
MVKSYIIKDMIDLLYRMKSLEKEHNLYLVYRFFDYASQQRSPGVYNQSFFRKKIAKIRKISEK